jgi:hypothetical protein
VTGASGGVCWDWGVTKGLGQTTSTGLTTFQPYPSNGEAGAGRYSGRVWTGVGKGISRGRVGYG